MGQADLLKAMLNPGEISDLSRTLQKMSGYLKNTVKEVKKLDAGTDPELNLLFHLWHRHNMAPGQFYQMPPGERAVVTALCEKELEVMAG